MKSARNFVRFRARRWPIWTSKMVHHSQASHFRPGTSFGSTCFQVRRTIALSFAFKSLFSVSCNFNCAVRGRIKQALRMIFFLWKKRPFSLLHERLNYARFYSFSPCARAFAPSNYFFLLHVKSIKEEMRISCKWNYRRKTCAQPNWVVFWKWQQHFPYFPIFLKMDDSLLKRRQKSKTHIRSIKINCLFWCQRWNMRIR